MNRRSERPQAAIVGVRDRLFNLALAASVVFVCSFTALNIRYARMIDWNEMRIAPMFAFLRGTLLYPPRTGGVVTGMIYSPLATLAYLPCAVLRNPSHIMESGSFFACTYYFGPLAFLAYLAVRRWEVPIRDALGVISAAALFTYFDPNLRYNAQMVHAEAPGFALAGLSLCLLIFSDGDQGRWLFAAGALAAASVLAKQTFVGVGLGLFLCLLVRQRKGAVNFFTGGFSVAAVFCACLFVSGSWRNFLFNCIYIPSHHPWTVHEFVLSSGGGGSIAVQRVQAVVESFLSIAPTWYPWIAVGAWILWRAHNAAPGEPVSKLAFPVWVFAAEFPLSLMAFKKIGGDVNALGGSLYFLLFGLSAMALASAAHRTWSASHRAALAMLMCTLMACNTPRLMFLADNSVKPDPNEQMMSFLHHHPQQVYLPWNPLLTGLSDGIDYQFEYGVFDRALAGVPMSVEAYRAHLPAKLSFAAVRRKQPDTSHGIFLTYLPELHETLPPPGLEDWIFYESASARSSP